MGNNKESGITFIQEPIMVATGGGRYYRYGEVDVIFPHESTFDTPEERARKLRVKKILGERFIKAAQNCARCSIREE